MTLVRCGLGSGRELKTPRGTNRPRGVRHAVPVALAALAVACIPYRPVPLDPPALGAAFSARRLDEPGLVHFLAARGVATADSGWRPRDLGLVAVYFHPVLDEARATLAVARAAEITAGGRPQPDASVGAELASAAPAGESAWTASLAAGVTLETGGKRQARIARARAATLSASLRLRAASWTVAFAADSASVVAVAADTDAAEARAESEALAGLVALLRARYAEGSVALADVAQVEAQLQASVVTRVESDKARVAARGALAGALALPLDETRTLAIQSPASPGCTLPDTLDSRRFLALALNRRDDLGAALADYAITEADVRIEVTRQRPDVHLGPGLAWDQGVVRWTLGFAFPAVMVNGNRGPIAESEARRAAAAVRFEIAQQRVIREAAVAQLQCSGEEDQLAATDSLVQGAEKRLQLAQAAYDRGETGAVEVAFARVARIRAARARNAARRDVTLASLALEQALGRWLSGPALEAGAIEHSPRTSEGRP